MPPPVIPFGAGLSSGIEELSGGTPSSLNCVADASGALRTRPGLSTWADFPAVVPDANPVVGIFAWNGYLIYVTQDSAGVRRLWALTTPGIAGPLSDATAASQLPGSLRPVFTADLTRLVVAGGGAPQKWEGIGLSARLGGSPPNFSHVAAISKRIVGNDSGVSGLFYWSGIGDTGHETWTTGLNFAEAEFKPDRALGAYTSSGELVVPGPDSVQVFSPDPSVVFSPVRSMDFGCGAVYSFTPYNEEFFILGTERQVMRSNGRSFKDVAEGKIAKTLDRLATVSDAWGFRAKFDASDVVAFQFPAVGRTFAYDVPLDRWSEWRSATGAFAPTSLYYWKDRKLYLAGMPDGRIMLLDPTVATDDGAPISVEATSPFLNQGTSSLKLCKVVRLRFRRAAPTDGSAEQFVELSYRDDLGGFCEPFRLSLGSDTDIEPVVELRSLGTYRQRQWRIRVSAQSFVLAGAEEDASVLAA